MVQGLKYVQADMNMVTCAMQLDHSRGSELDSLAAYCHFKPSCLWTDSPQTAAMNTKLISPANSTVSIVGNHVGLHTMDLSAHM